MIRRFLSIAVILGITLLAAGASGCDYPFVERAARANLVGFLTDVVGASLEESFFPGGG